MSKSVVETVIDQGINRFLADGVHYRDLMDLRKATPDWASWPATWSKWGDEAEKRADKAKSLNEKITAATEYARASLFHHYGQYLYFDDIKEKKRIHDKKVASFTKALSLFDVPYERVGIPYDGIKMAAYLRVPPGVKKAPVVILQGGLDTTKEDYLTVNDHCVKRGLATLAFDGPGQGETVFERWWPTDFEKSVFAAIDYLETRPEVDSNRIGVIGRSMGGCYAPKAAAMDPRIKALCAWGVMYHMRNLKQVPEHTQQGFAFVTNSKNFAEMEKFFETVDLSPYASKIKCPTLVVHGGLDAITPQDNADLLLKDLKCEVETMIWPDSVHCCHDRSHIVRPGMADFMMRKL